MRPRRRGSNTSAVQVKSACYIERSESTLMIRRQGAFFWMGSVGYGSVINIKKLTEGRMKKSACIFLLVALSFSFSVVGCGSSSDTSPQPQTVVLSQSDSGTTASLHQNQFMTVSLQGSGSTGYTWDVMPGAESILAQQGNPEFVPDSNAIGSGGTYKFTFKATALGTAPLNLIYHRPFEAGVAPLQTFGITVAVGS